MIQTYGPFSLLFVSHPEESVFAHFLLSVLCFLPVVLFVCFALPLGREHLVPGFSFSILMLGSWTGACVVQACAQDVCGHDSGLVVLYEESGFLAGVPWPKNTRKSIVL